MTRYWTGSSPVHCDDCKKKITTSFSDVRIPSMSVWAILCDECCTHHKVSYGTGYGQHYIRVSNLKDLAHPLVRWKKDKG